MNISLSKTLLLGFIFIATFFATQLVSAATIVVDSTIGDITADGQCNLAEAIANANDGAPTHGDCDSGSGGPDTIEFNVIGEITFSDIPDVTSEIFFNGVSHSGTCGIAPDLNDRDLRVSLIGPGMRFGSGSDGSRIQGFAIGSNGGSNSALTLADTSNITIACNHIGTNLAGDAVYGSGEDIGINLESNLSFITIGGPAAGDRNVISGNSAGISIPQPATNISNITIDNNYIGTNLAGDAAVNNCSLGFASATMVGIDTLRIQNNLFSGNADAYIASPNRCPSIVGSNSNTLPAIDINAQNGTNTNIEIIDNIVGLDATGTILIGNGGGGIAVNDAEGFTIQGNISSGNGAIGIGVFNSENGDITGNTVGLDITGSNAFSNVLNPDVTGEFPLTASVVASGSDIRIGGATLAERNIVAGNDAAELFNVGGILVLPNFIQGTPASDITIEGNYIGVGSDGITAFPNLSSGITFLGGAENSLVRNNVIHNSISIPSPGLWPGTGIVLWAETSIQPLWGYEVSIIENSIANHPSGNAIDIFNADISTSGTINLLGTNRNDASDADNGLNSLQNYPVIISAVDNGNGTSDITYMADFQADDYHIEFFTNDPLTNHFTREAKDFVDSTTITHAGNGPELFTTTLPIETGDIVTTTATRLNNPNQVNNYGSTSEVGNAVIVNGTGVQLGTAPAPYLTTLSDNGPYHIITEESTHYLGSCVQTEYLTVGSCAGNTDDDGVTFPSTMQWGQTHEITIDASADGILNAWIDLNMDGDFDDVDEHIADNLPITEGTNTITFTAPEGSGYIPTWARFRFTSVEALGTVPGAILPGNVSQTSFTGTGVDDITTSGVNNTPDTITYRLIVDTTTSPGTEIYNIFTDDDGFTNPVFVVDSQNVVTTQPYVLDTGDGWQLNFATNTGHTDGDFWEWTIESASVEQLPGILSPYGEALDGEVEDYQIYFGRKPRSGGGGGGRVTDEYLESIGVTLDSDDDDPQPKPEPDPTPDPIEPPTTPPTPTPEQPTPIEQPIIDTENIPAEETNNDIDDNTEDQSDETIDDEGTQEVLLPPEPPEPPTPPTSSFFDRITTFIAALLAIGFGVSTLPFRIQNILLAIPAYRRRHRPWGTVFDSTTGQPLDPAYVQLFDSEGNEVADAITDMDGRFSFLVPEGSYTLLANKTHYAFPSQLEKHPQYTQLYHGQVITITRDQIIDHSIPMDPINEADWNEQAKRSMNVQHFFSRADSVAHMIINTLFIIGLGLSVYVLIIDPAWYNSLIIGVYVFLGLLTFLGNPLRAYGKITDTKGNPLSGAIVRAYQAHTHKEIRHAVIGENGYYHMLVTPGEYIMTVEHNGTQVYQSQPFNAKQGVIKRVIKVNV